VHAGGEESRRQARGDGQPVQHHGIDPDALLHGVGAEYLLIGTDRQIWKRRLRAPFLFLRDGRWRSGLFVGSYGRLGGRHGQQPDRYRLSPRLFRLMMDGLMLVAGGAMLWAAW
jgi:hypothetical protein